MERKPKRASRHRARPVRGRARGASEASVDEIQRGLGPRIALMRHHAALTLEQLAAKTGFTKGYLSRIENARVIPPIATLVRIANVLGLGVADLFGPGPNETPDDRVSFVKRQDRQGIVRGGSSFGYDYFALATRRHGKRMTPFLMVFPEAVQKDVHFHHEGEEFIYLLEGRVAFELVVDGAPRYFILDPGDSLYFDSTLPHHGRSLRGASRALIVVSETASASGSVKEKPARPVKGRS
jgi:transcriptional regulator with XRE-family HTH domain